MAQTKIKFDLKHRPEFINELREKVKEYFELKQISKYGNASIITKSIFMVILYLTPLLLMYSGLTSSLISLFAGWIVMGIGMAGVGMVLMHDANHKSYSSNPTINKWLSKSLYFLGGFPPNWRYQHNTMHHGFTNIDGQDEDINPGPVLRLSPHKPLLKAHRFQHIYAWFVYGLMTLSWVTAKDFKQLLRYKKEQVTLVNNKNYKQLFTDLILGKIIYYIVFLILPLALIPLAWYWVILGFLSMHFISGFILGIVFQTAHVMPSSEYPLPNKTGNIENNWAIHQLLTTTNYAPKSRIFSWMIGGLNFQVEHHLFPNISHVHYKKLSVLVKNTAKKYDLPYSVQKSFYMAIINHFKMLKALGRA